MSYKLFLAAAALCLSGTAQAAVLVDFQQVGGNIVVTTSGTLNITGLSRLVTPFPAISAGVGVNPSEGVFSANTSIINFYAGFVGPTSFGPGGNFNGTGVGTPFHVFGQANAIGVSPTYVSGDAINAVTTLSGTFASRGLTQGTYTFTSITDTVTVQIGDSAVPEPASWAMMIGGFGMLGAAARRRIRTSVTYA